MKTKAQIIVRLMCVLTVVFFIQTAARASSSSIQKGDKELSLHLSFDHFSEGDNMNLADVSFGTVFSLGYLITNKLQIGGGLEVDWTKEATTITFPDETETVSQNSNETSFMPNVYLKYLFGEGRFRPFIGVGALFYYSILTKDRDYNFQESFSSESETQKTGYGAILPLGVKYFLSETTSLNFQYTMRYVHFSRNRDESYENYNGKVYEKDLGDDNDLGGRFEIGISYFF